MDPILIRRRPPKQKVNDFLIRHSKNITSQCGEDGILEEIFRLIDEYDTQNSTINSNPDRIRWCAEFGCWDGQHLCNTHNLITKHGFHGILIEADTSKFIKLQENYEDEIESGKVVALNDFVGFNDKSNCSLHHLFPQKYNISTTECSPSSNSQHHEYRDFDEIIDSLNVDIAEHQFDLIVIDIDGNDYHVFDSMVQYRSKVIMVEFNPTIPNNVIYVQKRDMRVQCGSSLLALIELAKHKEYELVSTTTYNAIFVDRHYYHNVFKPLMNGQDNSIYKMHDVPMETQIFQLYDGTLKIAGCRKLVWHKTRINEEKIQMIPKEKRQFPFKPIMKGQDTKKGADSNNVNRPKYVRRRKRTTKYSSTSVVTVLKAISLVAAGFVLGRIYQRRSHSNNT